jgi:anaerobic ribonucleoside-triphosphate reductase activating protein
LRDLEEAFLLKQTGEEVWLNIAGWEQRSVVNGPGERFVLWVQGCPFRCPGCFNQDYLPFIERHSFQVGELAEMIMSVSGIEGVTYSGGEPIAQAEGLYHLSNILKEHDLTVICYSGYTLGELEKVQNPWITHLLSTLDVLIDGRYDQEQRANLPWRGSGNQRIHFLTSVYEHLFGFSNEPASEVELIIGENGFVSTGIFDEAFLNRLEEMLKEQTSEKSVPPPLRDTL